MPKHEFGIMQEAPAPGVRYDEYEPQRYRCIAVDDDALLHEAAREQKYVIHFGI